MVKKIIVVVLLVACVTIQCWPQTENEMRQVARQRTNNELQAMIAGLENLKLIAEMQVKQYNQFLKEVQNPRTDEERLTYNNIVMAINLAVNTVQKAAQGIEICKQELRRR